MRAKRIWQLIKHKRVTVICREVHWVTEIPNVKEFFKNIHLLLKGLSFKLTNQVATFIYFGTCLSFPFICGMVSALNHFFFICYKIWGYLLFPWKVLRETATAIVQKGECVGCLHADVKLFYFYVGRNVSYERLWQRLKFIFEFTGDYTYKILPW